MPAARFAVPVLALILLQACKVGPNFAPPHEPVPEHYAGGANDPGSGAPELSDAAPPKSFWWREFHDAELDHLMEQTTAGNLDLKAAYLRIVEARLQVQSARAQGMPNLNASAAYTRDRKSVV